MCCFQLVPLLPPHQAPRRPLAELYGWEPHCAEEGLVVQTMGQKGDVEVAWGSVIQLERLDAEIL